MIRKDFQLIADALKASKPFLNEIMGSRGEQWCETCCNVADAVATSNIYFDRALFLDACGYATGIDLDASAFDSLERTFTPDQ